MAERKDCAFYEGCTYREEFGFCANYCMKYEHEDDSSPTEERKTDEAPLR